MTTHSHRQAPRVPARPRAGTPATHRDWYAERQPPQGEHPVAQEADRRVRSARQGKALQARIQRLKRRLQAMLDERQSRLHRELVDALLERDLRLRIAHYNIGFEAGHATQRIQQRVADAQAAAVSERGTDLLLIQALAAEIIRIANDDRAPPMATDAAEPTPHREPPARRSR